MATVRHPGWAPTVTTHDDHLVVSIVTPNLFKINAVETFFARLAWKTLFTPQKLGFGDISPRKWEAISAKPPKCTCAGRSGSSGVLVMSVSAIVPEKSRGNKKCDEEEEEKEEEKLRHIFGLFGIAVKWPRHGCMQLFWYLYVHSIEDNTLTSIFDQFRFSIVFLGLPNIGPNRCS